ncbi:MAG TPA: hypothetical protein DCF68_18650 [Cyanothece sp. UBA12306]|nr:hypothetical protein [Cyanothece sp. UBA12306]
MENNNKRDHSLFALEQGLFGNQTSQQQSHQPSAKKKQKLREKAQAFDFGEPIELQYNGDAYPTATPEAITFSDHNSFASELEDESMPFEVEAFEVDKEVTPVSEPITLEQETPIQPAIHQEVTPKPKEVQPVKVTVVPPSEMPLKSARPVEQPATVEQSSQKELSDAEAFAEDLQAILNGEKTYDPEQQQVVPTTPTAQPPVAPTSHPHDIFDGEQTAIPPQQPEKAEPVPISNSHAIFDQMGQNMAHATAFDQGTVDLALEMKFDEFDRLLDQDVQQMKVSDPPSNEHHLDKVPEETLEAKEMSTPLELEASEPQGDHDLIPQALATQKSPTTGTTASSLKDNEDLIPVDVWFY